MVITQQDAEVLSVGIMTSEMKWSNILHCMRLFSLLSSFVLFPLFSLFQWWENAVREMRYHKMMQLKVGYLVKKQIKMRPATGASSCCLLLKETIDTKIG